MLRYAPLLAVFISSVAVADRQDDLAFAVKEGSSYAQSLVISKLMTFELGDKCWDKVLDKNQATLGRMGSNAGNVIAYAKTVTGDDWRAIESQSGDKATNRALVAKMVDDMAKKVHITVKVDGDDCAKDSALWTKYLGTTTGALKMYPPKSGKAFITINVSAKARGVKTEISKDGSTFTITGSRDIEKSGWSDEIEKPMKRVSTGN